MAHSIKFSGNLLLFILSLLLLTSCGTTEEVRTIEEGPRTPGDRTAEETDTDQLFQELTVGMIDPVDNLDPLFANNLSTMRILSLIYDGLFTIDRDGEVVPAIADSVNISDDERVYTITLNNDLFFHDSSAFMSGIGRRLQAADVKWAFERTARANVPTRASELLKNIQGYEEYFEDQRNIYDTERRTRGEVTGIRVLDSRTIEFRLHEPDSDFLRKLASPYLFIYPREVIQRDGFSLKSNPVGTGAYTFINRSENSIELSKDNSDRMADRLTQPNLNRIEFVYYPSESDLFQALAQNNIDWIPEVGPETYYTAFTPEGDLEPGYQNEYVISSGGERQVDLYLNQTRRVNINWLHYRLSEIEVDTATTGRYLTINQPPPEVDSDQIGEPDDRYLVTFTSDLFARNLLSNIQAQYLEPDSEFNLSDLRTPVSRSSIYTISTDSFHRQIVRPRPSWITYVTPVYGLHHQNIDGIINHQTPWKLFVEDIRVENGDQP
ncbi:ABC transporter substrate-binding protein [Rhodohalobacter sp. SW132]|uniref:ABC transporter substrate-binding protein n=1 Tax=Rhodohalobacter sp. SW132 TaxID=2293433 RepID=UPI000E23B720|nr:ABC transporter substrate-binding protein [Rhodohalobacter sp. SW132]REL38864.1 ABC transporter substrate-binding protein [Rhodohalobacter sp. SW132]